MDLKEFIKETISSIADATVELQEKYADKGVIINPLMSDGEMKQHLDAPAYKFQRVENVQFDVAVTAASETTGKAGARIKVWPAEIGGGGAHLTGSESVSRVQFSMPVVLPPPSQKKDNREGSSKAPGWPGGVVSDAPMEDPR